MKEYCLLTAHWALNSKMWLVYIIDIIDVVNTR